MMGKAWQTMLEGLSPCDATALKVLLQEIEFIIPRTAQIAVVVVVGCCCVIVTEGPVPPPFALPLALNIRAIDRAA